MHTLYHIQVCGFGLVRHEYIETEIIGALIILVSQRVGGAP
jgi:hypothetical protein